MNARETLRKIAPLHETITRTILFLAPTMMHARDLACIMVGAEKRIVRG